MEGYKCAYRDTNSPLAPIAPLVESSFTFNQSYEKRTNSPYSMIERQSSNKHLLNTAYSVTPKNRLVKKSENGKQTPFPHRIKTSNHLTPKRNLSQNTNKTYSDENYSPKFLTPQNQLTDTFQNWKLTPQSTQRIKTPVVLKEISNDITPRSRFSEKIQIVDQNQSGGGYKIKYSQKKIQLQIDGKEILVEEENIEANIKSRNKNCLCFKRASPVQPRALSPRVNKILDDNGMSKYTKLFETEEIDFQVFQMLTPNDLKRLGINVQNHLDTILDAVNFWKNEY